jgi:hypothetical protein
MRRMRVLQVVASSRGGGATHMLALASGLAARGHEVAATMPADGGTVEPPDFEMAGVRFHTLVGNSGSFLGPYRTLSGLLADVAPDVVHGHGSRAAFWARRALQGVRSRRPALVCSVHGFAAPFYPLSRRIVGIARGSGRPACAHTGHTPRHRSYAAPGPRPGRLPCCAGGARCRRFRLDRDYGLPH